MRKIIYLFCGLFFLVSCASVSVNQLSELGVKHNYSVSDITKGIFMLTPQNLEVLGRPAFSENQIYFNGYDRTSKSYQIFSINSMGTGGVSQITRGQDSPSNPKISKDNKYLFYLDKQGKVWRIKKDGSGGKRSIKLTDNPIASFDILGEKIVFSTERDRESSNSKSMIWTSNIDGGKLTQLGEGDDPIWSPDGGSIVYENDNDIFIMDAAGTNIINLTNTEKEYEKFPSFSPDGEMVCFSLFSKKKTDSGKYTSGYTDTDIYIMKRDGSEKIQYTKSTSEDVLPLWSENGKIYFISYRGTSSSMKKTLKVWTFTPEI